jgi:hypothetical protein
MLCYLHVTVALLPCLLITVFYSLIVRMRIFAATWEFYAFSSESVPFGVHECALGAAFIALLISPVAIVLISIVRLLRGRHRSVLLVDLFYLASFAVCLLLARFDPGKFLAWY